ncbi:MAG: DUF1385 domain-containing protein [Thermomicrobiaceae bacterium]
MSETRIYGGQAVMEGVMMRGRRHMAVAVRAPNGEIAVYHEPLSMGKWTERARPLPFIRGVFMLWDTLVLGMRSLVFSANVGLIEGDVKDNREAAEDDLTGTALWVTVGISILFSIGLFFVLPLALVGFLDRYIESDTLSNVVEGAIRLAILIGYMLLIGRMNDIKRVFSYHGAEHKTINAYEAGDELTVDNVRSHSISHPRCGTGFLLVVVLLSIFVFALLGRPDWFWRISSRIFLVPLIAAVAYEFIKLTAQYYENTLVRILVAPSMALQRLTTRPPDDGMLEVAIVSFKQVQADDGEIDPSEIERDDVVQVDESGIPMDRPSEQPVYEPEPLTTTAD